MKLTELKLRSIVKEELKKVLNEMHNNGDVIEKAREYYNQGKKQVYVNEFSADMGMSEEDLKQEIFNALDGDASYWISVFNRNGLPAQSAEDIYEVEINDPQDV